MCALLQNVGRKAVLANRMRTGPTLPKHYSDNLHVDFRMKDSTRSTLHFLLMFFGVCILLAGAIMWVGLRDYDHHYAFEGEYDQMPDKWNDKNSPSARAEYDEKYASFQELSERQRGMFEQAVDRGEQFTFQSQGEVPPTLIRKGETYYMFTYHKTFDWTDSGMGGATLLLFGGFWLTFEGIRREQFPHVPVYRNVFRRVTGPLRRS